jgi:hypothetical protein
MKLVEFIKMSIQEKKNQEFLMLSNNVDYLSFSYWRINSACRLILKTTRRVNIITRSIINSRKDL